MKLVRLTIVFHIVALLFSLIPLKDLFAAQILFTPRLTLTETYSDNIFLSNSDEEEDYITTTGLDLSLQVLGRTAGLTLSLNPSYNFFANNSDLDYWRYAGRLYLWNDFGPNTKFEITNDYLETENPRDQTEDISTDLNRRGRNRYRNNTSQGRLSHQFGARDNVYAALQYSYWEDIDPPSDQLVGDYTNWQPLLGMEYWFLQRWGFKFDGYYSNRDYADRNDRQEYQGSLRLQYAFQEKLTGFVGYKHTVLDFDQETDDDYQVYEPSVGFKYKFQEDANISLSVGYYIQDFDRQDEIEEGWIVNSEIYKKWNFRSGYLTVTGASGYQIADKGTQDLGFDIYYQARIETGYNFTYRLSANLFGGYRQDKYQNQVPDRTDQTLNTGASLSYQAFKWMNLSLSYNFNNVTSDLETEEYTENSATLMITLQPSSPYRLN